MSLAETGRRLGLGKLALAFYHRPVGRIRESLRNGGPLAERETERQRQEMEMAAARFGALPTFPGGPAATLHLMSGRRFWYQTIFCLHSFARTSGVNLRVELYDDGTIDPACAERLCQLGPGLRIHAGRELIERRDALLPTDRFPHLRERWLNYPNIRKLIDVHLGSTGWKLVIDSDLLFFRRASFLLDWLAKPQAMLVATDCEESYGYSRPLLERIAAAPLPHKLNVGICGLRSESLDWPELEAWTAELHRREKTNYYLEQALVAMLAARNPSVTAPATDYLTKPERAEAVSPHAVMHHYVATSKRWYFRFGWRHFAP